MNEELETMYDEMDLPIGKDQRRVRGEYFPCLFEDIYRNKEAAQQFEDFLMRDLIRVVNGLCPGIGSELQAVINQCSESYLPIWEKVR